MAVCYVRKKWENAKSLTQVVSDTALCVVRFAANNAKLASHGTAGASGAAGAAGQMASVDISQYFGYLALIAPAFDATRAIVQKVTSKCKKVSN